MEEKTIEILGTSYNIKVLNETDKDYQDFIDLGADALHNGILREIRLKEYDLYNEPNIEYQLLCVRHEIIHAYLYQSGLDSSANGVTCWARNEEMIDYFALQLYKINQTIKIVEEWLWNLYHEKEDEKELNIKL